MSDNPNTFDFETFFSTWLVRQQNYLSQLQNHEQEEGEITSLVREVMVHYKLYYEAKSRVARDNVFILFSPPWLSTFEQTFLWAAGFKPGLAFKVLEKSVGSELTTQQVAQVERVRARKRAMEKILNDELIKVQESIVTPTWVELLRRTRRQQVLNAEVDRALGSIKDRMKELVVNADFLRATTARELVDILTPLQAAKFLTAMGQLQLKIRALGQQKDAQRMHD